MAAIQSAQAAAANGVVVQLDQQNANVSFLKILGDLNNWYLNGRGHLVFACVMFLNDEYV